MMLSSLQQISRRRLPLVLNCVVQTSFSSPLSTCSTSTPNSFSSSNSIGIKRLSSQNIQTRCFATSKSQKTVSITGYSLEESLRLAQAMSNRNFDETIDIAIRLGVDPRKPNQMVRGVAKVPFGSGQTAIIAVFAQGVKAEEAKAAGADIVGGEDLAADIMAGKINFNRCIATPDMMKVVGKVARVLGPRGLMPNPKLGSVTSEVKEAIESAKRGQIEFRTEKMGIVHAPLGKVSWPLSKLKVNTEAFVRSVLEAKPTGAKGNYFLQAHISSTMGPGIEVDIRGYPFKDTPSSGGSMSSSTSAPGKFKVIRIVEPKTSEQVKTA